MKNHRSWAMRAAMTLFMAVLAPLTAAATEFITDVVLIGHDDRKELDFQIKGYEAAGWTAVEKDLNAGCGSGSDYIYLLYKTTASPDNSGTPITGFYIHTGENPPVSVTYDGHTYGCVPYTGSDGFINSFGDLNHGAHGDYIYLYYTTDDLPGHPKITDITFNNIENGAVSRDGGVDDDDDGVYDGYDLNAGCGSGTDYIYMHLTTFMDPNMVMLTSTTTDVELQDGAMLAGRAVNEPHVTIADGATVTLSGAEIYVNEGKQWPGITCLGNAVIILDDGMNNKVRGGQSGSAIFVPEGKTLTIKGNGSLTASAYSGSSGAGIGGYRKTNCGAIVIEDGTIDATGDDGAAGIGCGKNGNCDSILISGGNITAAGGHGAAGIGCGTSDESSSICYDITISGGTVKTNGGSSGAGIGSGQSKSIHVEYSVCYLITISGGSVNAQGGEKAAGIGTGAGDVAGNLITDGWVGIRSSLCNEILISGGSVNAKGGVDAAGIGSGQLAGCGNITITTGVTIVTATKGSPNLQYHNSIGCAHMENDSANSTCQTVTIGGVVTDPIVQSPFTTYPYTVNFNANGGTGTMDSMIYMYGVAQKLTANSFTHPEGSSFIGWALTPNGPAVFDDCESVSNLVETSGDDVTLYAKWKLETLTSASGEISLFNGNILTGTGGSATHVTIADGATVTLSGVNITAIPNHEDEPLPRQWPGITCLGDAVIILDEGTTNNVKGGARCSGIYVPEGKTLTIQGSGKLNVTGGTYGAGIGSDYKESTCGNIIISGGTITATGGWMGAGIGSGYYASACGDITILGGSVTAASIGASGIGSGCYKSTCGNITISGGTITAYGDEYEAAIGSSNSESVCGDITITNDVTRVTLIMENAFGNTIGAGTEGSTCGTITIGNELTDETEGNTRCLYHLLTLADTADNTEAISNKNGRMCKAVLSGRTLYKDGQWNTLCLPFAVSNFTGTPIEGATVKTLNSSDFDNGKLTLSFSDDLTSIEAGKPYIVKWDNASEAIENPVFSDVTIDGTTRNAKTQYVNFVGTFAPKTFNDEHKSILMLDDTNTLYFPEADAGIGACRAFLELESDADITSYVLNIDDIKFQTILGDVNGDGSVTPADAIMILYHYFNVEQNGFNAAAADMNGDQNITPADAIEALYKFFNSSQSHAPRKSQPAREPQ